MRLLSRLLLGIVGLASCIELCALRAKVVEVRGGEHPRTWITQGVTRRAYGQCPQVLSSGSRQRPCRACLPRFIVYQGTDCRKSILCQRACVFPVRGTEPLRRTPVRRNNSMQSGDRRLLLRRPPGANENSRSALICRGGQPGARLRGRPTPCAVSLVPASRGGVAYGSLKGGDRLPRRPVARFGLVRGAALRNGNLRRPPVTVRTFAGRPCIGSPCVPSGGYRRQPFSCCRMRTGGCFVSRPGSFKCPWMDYYDGPVTVAKHWWEGPVAREPIALTQEHRDELAKTSLTTLERIDRRQRLSIGDVRQLSKAGLPKDVIIDQLRSTGTCYHLTNQQVFQLQHWMVNPDVIAYLQFCSGER